MPVEALSEHDAMVREHFSNPEIHFIGSTSGCGCNFPHVDLQGGSWPCFEDPEIVEEDAVSERKSREGLVSLLRSSGDSTVELYGIWYGDFAESPQAYEDIPVEAILQQDFRLKERGFYKVFITPR